MDKFKFQVLKTMCLSDNFNDVVLVGPVLKQLIYTDIVSTKELQALLKIAVIHKLARQKNYACEIVSNMPDHWIDDRCIKLGRNIPVYYGLKWLNGTL